jgi:hypothetical protein
MLSPPCHFLSSFRLCFDVGNNRTGAEIVSFSEWNIREGGGFRG